MSDSILFDFILFSSRNFSFSIGRYRTLSPSKFPFSLIPKYLHKLGVKIEYNLLTALKWCDVVNMLRIQNERMKSSYFPSIREYKKHYGLTMSHLGLIDNEIIVMHPGPINRGVEISSDVADSKYSIILDQVENGVAIRMAVIYLLAKKNTFKVE